MLVGYDSFQSIDGAATVSHASQDSSPLSPLLPKLAFCLTIIPRSRKSFVPSHSVSVNEECAGKLIDVHTDANSNLSCRNLLGSPNYIN